MEPLTDGHARLANELVPLTVLRDLLATWTGQLAIAELEHISLLRSTLIAHALLLLLVFLAPLGQAVNRPVHAAGSLINLRVERETFLEVQNLLHLINHFWSVLDQFLA